MNIWKANYFELCRNILRFALWICLTLNGLMLGVFSIVFTFALLTHAWSWCRRVLFKEPW